MYRIPIYRVQLVRDSSQAAERKQVSQPADAAAILRAYLGGVDREHFVVLLLDTKHAVIGINTVSIGILDSTPVHPREVFKPAVVVNAAAVIVAHNHPSGDCTPSPDDRAVTKRLVDAGELLGIPVLDHIIVGDGTQDFVSLKALGLM